MPLIKMSSLLPQWAEMKYYEIIRLKAGESYDFTSYENNLKEKWILCEGLCELSIDHRTIKAHPGDQFDWNSDDFDTCRMKAASSEIILVRMCGVWGEERGGSGLFSKESVMEPSNHGDPVDYPRNTKFDNHYHDCDEYYIFYDGIGVVVTEGRQFIVSAGDCILTGRGQHHDIPLVVEPLKAVFFETTLAGQKRRGHLWNHTHGIPDPDPQRI
ncbi:cupin domain-containing protein [Neobacillus sp. Marseille-QA0830]